MADSDNFAFDDKRYMNLFLRKILLTFFFCQLIVWVHGQVIVSQEVFPSQINKDEYATLKITVQNSNDIQQLIPPSFRNFIVLSGPNQETGMSSVNGHVKQYTALSFILKPKQPGKFSIDAALVNVAGKNYKTNTTELTVKNTASANGSASSNMVTSPFAATDPLANAKPANEFTDYILRKGENVTDKVNRNMELKLVTNKTSCYVGEPVVATYKLYTRLKSDSKLTENPAFNGFSVIDLTRPDYMGYTREKLNGKEYNVYTIRKAQLYPLQPGNIDLEVAELENNIQFIKADYVTKRSNDVYGLFDEFTDAMVPPEGIISQTVNLKSQPVTILVKPLPELNKPASFSGAVGNFSIEAQFQKTSFPANEAGKLIVKISGKGNLQLLTAPVLQWPAGIDPFDPKLSEELDKMSVPVSGSKTFEYSFSVNKEGDYSLPAIQFSYFDPVTASYKTLTTKEFLFSVTKATGTVVSDTTGGHDIETVSGINRIFTNRWWIIEFLAIVMITGLIIYIRKDKKATKEEKNITEEMKEEDIKMNEMIEVAAVNQQNPLSRSEECLYTDNCTGFYSLLNTELKTYLSHKFLLKAAEVNTKSIAVAMDKKNINNDLVLRLQRLLQEIEWQLYTPFERNKKMHELYKDAQEVIQLINTYDIRHL